VITHQARTTPGLRSKLFAAVVLPMLSPFAGGAIRAADGEPPAPSAGPVVRGSVEQIHIAHARPGARVSVRGRGGFQTTTSTDVRGGFVLREVPPGDGYTVTVDGSGGTASSIRVLSRHEHPGASFYSAQKLDPTQGYVKTRDGTLLSYRVVLPDPKVHGKGPYDLVITYSGYQPGLKTGDGYQNKPFEQFSALGYAVAGVNMRGSGCSGGAFDFMEPLTWLDGYDRRRSTPSSPGRSSATSTGTCSSPAGFRTSASGTSGRRVATWRTAGRAAARR
jgi:uncharacterized protein